MSRLHPPVHLLRAFVATARQSTISGAARELHLTQGAVSKQVIELEAMLGLDLFMRVRGRLVLSPAGQRYLPAVSQALQQLETATLDVMAQQGRGGVLNLSTTPTFGAKWLIPRLPAFQSAHPEVFLNFIPFSQGRDFALPQLDCAFRYGEGVWPDTTARYIAGREFILIAPPGLPAAQKLRQRGDIRQHALLQHPSEPTAWLRWCEAYGVDHPNPVGGPRLDQVTSIVRAVMAGLGIGLVPLCLVKDDIDNGLVEAPFASTLTMPSGYYFCYPEAKAGLPALAAFEDWVATQADAA
ncbi:LysR substrate-binding domain-containing protein [Variovorax terrae]|uniref:LysR substrate-binding domain-containing protein n=1 Tax=Variovorax terrae TaxID=2923278 RepID=A0A9X1VV16_9BURK|nr:LysR substrate-binding domain-containing protein [Variovorax terrae]MCJ0763470.1 LysR substrate-binding domain-containing protein [Variovorax terrae]